MKYIVILGDGMADYPIPQLGDKTPLQKAKKKNMDYLARNGLVGLVKTVPDGISPGSDTANLSVLGYDPTIYYTGRSPLEAVSMGLSLDADDVAFRCNLVTLSQEYPYENKAMVDYSSDEISSEEASELINTINHHFENDVLRFYPGISYRHCMVWKNGPGGFKLTPPHDILEKKITSYLPDGEQAGILADMMRKSFDILDSHPVNIKRREKGLKPANSIWLWGDGKKPAISNFYDKYNMHGSVISAVDLIKGIGICAGLRSVDVEGATGNIHTCFKGKAFAALEELENGSDFVYVHIEAPDECGHRYEVENKVRSIELIDEEVVGVMLPELEKFGEYRIMVLPDHPTPLSLRTHTGEPVPFLIYDSRNKKPSGVQSYDEESAKASGLFVDKGHTLMDKFLER